MREKGSAVWGGATLGLFVGLILGLFVGSSYWTTVLIAVGIGAASGIAANILAWSVNVPRYLQTRKRAKDDLEEMEEVLHRRSPVDFEKTPDAAAESIYAVGSIELDESWRAGYASLDAFYAAHEAQHPDIRFYAAVYDELGVGGLTPPGIGGVIAERLALRRSSFAPTQARTSKA